MQPTVQPTVQPAIALTRTKYFVRSPTPSRFWQPCYRQLSNADMDPNSQKYAVYEVFFPPIYRDVAIYPRGLSGVESLPSYHVEILRPSKRLMPEPFTILLKKGEAVSREDFEIKVKALASWHLEEVCKRVEKLITKQSKLVASGAVYVDDVKQRWWLSKPEGDEKIRRKLFPCEGGAGLAGAEWLLDRFRLYLKLVDQRTQGDGLADRLAQVVEIMKAEVRQMAANYT